MKPLPPLTSVTSGTNFVPSTNYPIIQNDLTNQFSRWVFLQSILSDEMTKETREDVNLVFYHVLRSFLDQQKKRMEGDVDCGFYDDYDDGDDNEESRSIQRKIQTMYRCAIQPAKLSHNLVIFTFPNLKQH